MSLSPSTLPLTGNLVYVRAPRLDRSDPALRAPLALLESLHEPDAWSAAVLALLVTPHSRRERGTWSQLTHRVRNAEALYDAVLSLPAPRRLPWFEHFARTLAPGPVALRHGLIGAARRVMTADGLVSPLDQLRWIALRHLLAGSAVSPPAAAHGDLASLQPDEVRQVGIFSAFLSHLVPAPELTLDLTGWESVSEQWYLDVTAAWDAVPAREGHDIDATLRALRALQSLPWLLRPVLVRMWFDAARALTEGPALHADAADALRLSCVLLDSPVPPELGQQYIEVETAHHH